MNHALFGKLKYDAAAGCWVGSVPLPLFAAVREPGSIVPAGHLPVRIGDPEKDGPSPQQEASFRYLVGHEQAVFDTVLAEVLDAYRAYYNDERWRRFNGMRPVTAAADLRGLFALSRLDLSPEHRGGFAHLVFPVECDWKDEHGVLVVYSPDWEMAGWGSLDILHELLETDEPEG